MSTQTAPPKVVGGTSRRDGGAPPETPGTAASPGWAFRYTPVMAITVALVLALAILPSALNVPQPNPATTLEYAPVPPKDDDVPPPGGNFSSLGLGSSSTVGEADGGNAPRGTAATPPPVKGKNPSTKNCVGDPPRQTEDPLSPPCVAFFDGDNFGATYRGVSKSEINALFYIQGGMIWISSRGTDTAPRGAYYDLNEPGGEDLIWVRGLRAFMRYFNSRYQTYGRSVHMWVYFSNGNTVEQRRADAQDNFTKVNPFAVITHAPTNEDPYTKAIAQRDALVFIERVMTESAFFEEHKKRIWGFLPSLEEQAEQYASFVCEKVVPHPVSFSGNSGDMGQKRRLGFMRTADQRYPQIIQFSEVVKKKIEACGGVFVAEATHPEHRSIYNEDRQPLYASQNMADFQQKGVTTVIWPGGFEAQQSKAAARINYRPEWILAGDGTNDGSTGNAHQDRSAWQYAWIVSNVTWEPEVTKTTCYAALREGDPDIPHADAREMCSFSNFYEAIRQFFIGIQVAGPKLTPDSIDRGFHAIPSVASEDPQVPACFYRKNDYTCVKDAQAMWWDVTGASGTSTAPGNSGCWRSGHGGKRYITGTWPDGDVLNMRGPNDPCNSFGGNVSLR